MAASEGADGHEVQEMPALPSSDLRRLVAALLVAVTGGLHALLYREEYRDIHVDEMLGIDVSRSFLLATFAAAALATALVLTVVVGRGGRQVALAGIAFAVGSLAAYALTRTVGFLGFEESRWTTEAILSKLAEVGALVALVASLARGTRPAAEAAA